MFRLKYFWPYLLFFFSIAILVVANVAGINYFVENNISFIKTINVAGRQRMYSEQLVKDCLGYYDGHGNKKDILQTLEQWNDIHYDLQKGGEKYKLHPISFIGQEQVYDKLNPAQQQLYATVRIGMEDSLTVARMQRIVRYQQAYLANMEQLVAGIEQQAREEINGIKTAQGWLALASGLILVLEMAMFIYPYHKRLVSSFKKLKEQREEIDVQAEQLLHMNDTHELTMKGIAAGVWDWDIVAGTEVWTPKFYELLGFEPGEIPATFSYFLNNLLHPDDRPKVEKAIENHLQNHAPYREHVRLLCKDATYRWFEASGQALWNDAGAPVRMAGSIIDIDASVMYRSKLEYNEFLLQEAGNMAKLGGWEYDIATSKMTWSETMYEINEVPVGDEGIMRKSMLERYPEQYHNMINETLLKATKYGEPFDIELQLITAKGKLKWIRSMGVPVKDSTGRIVHLRGVYQDINDRKLKELELQETKDELESTNRTKDKLFSIVAHDLRTPLAGLSALIEMQQDEIITKEEFMELTSLVRVNLNFLSGTMDNLLHWAQDQLGGITFRPGRMRINDSIEEAINLYNNAIVLKHITVNYDGSEELFAHADHDQVFLIIRNLVNNAIKFTPDNGVIDITANIQGEQLVVAVKDNGVGMSHGALQTIRDNKYLFSTQGTMGEKGSGLGLNLCFEMAVKNGGSMDVQSEQGKGSTFTLTLPLAATNTLA